MNVLLLFDRGSNSFKMARCLTMEKVLVFHVHSANMRYSDISSKSVQSVGNSMSNA